MIKAIIFDWGGTLVDEDTLVEFPEAEEVLNYCKVKGYQMAAASLTSDLKRRLRQFEQSSLL